MSSKAQTTKRLRVRSSGPLRGTIRVPGDKSIGHRAILFAALADGESTIRGLSGGLDNASTASAFEAMGARFHFQEDATGTSATVAGTGLDGLSMPTGALDCGNSGTTMRMLAGVLAGQRFGTRLIGDASLSSRPMRRIVDPLRARGAHIAGVRGKKEGEHYPPLSVAPLIDSERLGGIEYRSPIASAQVKSALLLSGLWAEGPTVVTEPTISRDHTERMMQALGIPLRTAGSMVVLDPANWARGWSGFTWDVPGDISTAAFLIAAALLVPGSEVSLEHVGTNPTRTGFLDALRGMRAPLTQIPRGDAAGSEPISKIEIAQGPLARTAIGGELVTRMIDEVPIFAALLARADGRSEVRDAEELRVKESDRLTASAKILQAFGADCVELRDGLTVHGSPRKTLQAAHVHSGGDHRIAMTAAILGMIAEGETIIDDVGCIDTSFPQFVSTMRGLGAEMTVEDVLEERAPGSGTP